ncbi:MAG TPA: hypothetical protein VMW25_05830 [Clostridia bacterium]|nr:hypothetical protein [Clostridia bacterium]
MARKKKQKKPSFRLDGEALRARLKAKHQLSEKALREKYPQAVKFLEERKLLGPGKIREHATKLLTSGALASSLLLASPHSGMLGGPPSTAVSMTASDLVQSLSRQLSSLLPQKIEPLTSEQETKISHLLFRTFGIQAVPQLGSTRLNHVYGLIGAEQHLPRYPGDTINQHDEYQKSGITPGLGAWGYFTRSKKDLTPDLVLKEKYYVAVQTLYLPDWPKRTKFLYDWYKYRKVIVVNPLNGKSIVACVADAGPAHWTGKHFGGSPEVMAYLGLNVGMQKGPVILFFVDDPENKVPLGPLEYNLTRKVLS